MGKAH
jgi:hypothetical protein